MTKPTNENEILRNDLEQIIEQQQLDLGIQPVVPEPELPAYEKYKGVIVTYIIHGPYSLITGEDHCPYSRQEEFYD
jgi:hypothetical protein